MGIVIGPVGKPHFPEQLPAFCLDFLQNGLFVRLEVRSLLTEQFLGQGDIFQRGVLGEEIEGLEHHAEVKPLAAHLIFSLRSGIGGIKEGLPLHADGAAVRRFQKVQAAQKGGLSGAGGTDDGQRLAFFQ